MPLRCICVRAPKPTTCIHVVDTSRGGNGSFSTVVAGRGSTVQNASALIAKDGITPFGILQHLPVLRLAIISTVRMPPRWLYL